MQHSGYIVVAINFVNGDKAVYKIGCGSSEPGSIPMKGQVFLEEDDNTIEFFGCELVDDEECWFRVPPTAYASVSWKWYSARDLARQAEVPERTEATR
jgi:hypothetical protein